MEIPPKPIKEELPSGYLWKVIYTAMIYSVLLVIIPLVLEKIVVSQTKFQDHDAIGLVYSFTLMVILPLVQGLFMGCKLAPYRVRFIFDVPSYSMLAVIFCVIDFAAAMLFAGEGIICLIIAFPLYLIINAVGLMLGNFYYRMTKDLKNEKLMRLTIMPLVALAVLYDGQMPAPDYSNAVSDAVTIQAPPEYVWKYIVQYPENTKAPEYWLWKLGLPEPIQSVASAQEVGAARECKFTNGIKFDEEITELVPNEVMTFKVTGQPKDPEVLGHFSFDKGQLRLEKNPDGSTTVIATSWYRLFVRPATYFNWWTTDITRNVHFRVLNHMKELAEKDYSDTLHQVPVAIK